MDLYCVRHAEAELSADDATRPLSEQGQKDIEKVAKYLGQYDLHIRHIIHSGKLRAKQTAEVLAKYLKIEDMTEAPNLLDDMADVGPMREMIKTWSEHTMLVGHLPFMPTLISALVVGDKNTYPLVNYPPGCVVALNSSEQHRWIINWLLRPNIVPDCFHD